MKGVGGVDRVLPGHGVGDEEDFAEGFVSAFSGLLISSISAVVDAEAAGRIDDEDVVAEVACLAERLFGEPEDERVCHAARRRSSLADRRSALLTDLATTWQAVRARRGGRRRPRPAWAGGRLFLSHWTSLPEGGGFARALEAGHEDDGGGLGGELEAGGVAAEQVLELVGDDLDELFCR